MLRLQKLLAEVQCGKPWAKAMRAAAEQLCTAETTAAGSSSTVVEGGVVPAFRAELGRMCQAAMKEAPSDWWKDLYRKVLRKEPLA